MQKFLTNLLLVLAIMAVLLFFSPLSSMLDFWEPAASESSAPAEELPVADEDVADTSEDIDVTPTGPVIEMVTDTDDTTVPALDGEVEAGEDVPDAVEAIDNADEPVAPETAN